MNILPNEVTKADIIACCQEFFTGDADKVSKLLNGSGFRK
jgi:hypothetical protein